MLVEEKKETMMSKTLISKADALLIRIDQLGVRKKSPKKSEIRRANKKLKEVADLTGVNIRIEEEAKKLE